MRDEQEEPPNLTKIISHYSFDLGRKLGEGSFSQVFQGVDQRTAAPVAVKRVRTGELRSKIARRLLDCEIATLRVVDHPHIVRCHEVISSVNNCYLVTELCAGGDLDTVLRREGKVPDTQVPKIIVAVASALEYLGRAGIVHRDVKVSNILMDGDSYKLADFGFAIQARRVFKDVAVGSPVYMSPEGLIHNLYGPKTDVWALGVLIYQLTHSNTPLAHCSTEEELKVKILEPPQIDPSLPEDLQQLILACMAVEQSKRATIQEVVSSSYIRRVAGQEEKDLTLTALSSCSSRSELSYSLLPQLTYDSAVALINYCRLVHKVAKTMSSEVFARSLLWWSVGLAGARIRMDQIGQQKQTNLRWIIKDYHEKYLTESKGLAIRHVGLAELRQQCECKMKESPESQHLARQFLRESELLAGCFEQGSLESFAKKSRARTYANAPSNSP